MTNLTHAPVSAPVPPPVAGPSLPFHRLGVIPGRSWWRPLAVLAVATAVYAVLMLLCLLPFTIAGLDVLSDDFSDPLGLGTSLAAIVLLAPACVLAVHLVGRRRPGTLLSVAGRMRWRLVGWGAAATAVVMLPVLIVQLLLDPPTMPVLDPGRVALLLVLTVALVPLQSAAEEIVFRGLLPQVIGGWLRHPLWAYALPLALFTAGHLYNLPGMIAVGIFGAAAAWLTWRSGGVELAIGIHAVNNVAAFALAAVGLSDPNDTQVPWSALVESAAALAVVVVLCWLLLRRTERGHRLDGDGASALQEPYAARQ